MLCRCLRVQPLVSLWLVVAVVLCAAPPAWSADPVPDPPFQDQMEETKSKKRSWLVERNGGRTTYKATPPGGTKEKTFALDDRGLAELFKEALTRQKKPGSDERESVVKDATFLFNNCYGGGFLDDLKRALGETINWLGASATNHENPAGSAKDPPKPGVENGKTGTWSEQLVRAKGTNGPKDPGGFFVRSKNPRIQDAVNTAHQNNPRKDDATSLQGKKYKEVGQTTGSTDKKDIRFTSDDTDSYHAIIWAGKTDEQAVYNDIKRLRDALEAKWGPTGKPVEIITLFGDGKKQVFGPNGKALPASWEAREATGQELAKAIQDVGQTIKESFGQDKKEKFFFFSHDHGRKPQTTKGRQPAPPGSKVAYTMALDPLDFDFMVEQPYNEPVLTLTYEDVISSANVLFNGTIVGALDPNLEMMDFDIDESLIGLSNLIEVVNAGQPTFVITEVMLDPGAIGIVTSIPEPATSTIFLGLLLAAMSRHRRDAR